MKRKYYYPNTVGAMLPFLQNICAKMPNYVVPLGITGPEQSFLNLMCALWNALVDFENRSRRFAEDWTATRRACFDGPTDASMPAWPVWTGPATPPVGLTVGCGLKLRAIVRRWKSAPGYNEGIGEDLGIVGDEINVDPNTVTPEVRVNVVGGHPQVSAGLQTFDAVEFHVNRGTGFSLLNVSTGAPVEDDHALPPLGESDVWTYKAILRQNNQRVGQWSNPVSVPVVGI